MFCMRYKFLPVFAQQYVCKVSTMYCGNPKLNDFPLSLQVEQNMTTSTQLIHNHVHILLEATQPLHIIKYC